MIYQLAAEATLVLHICFGVFVAAGWLAVWRYPRLAWLHVPTLIWGTLVNVNGWVCPLTPIENYFRRLGGDTGYEGTFVEEYLLPVVYSGGSTGVSGFDLGVVVASSGVITYGFILYRWHVWRKHSV